MPTDLLATDSLGVGPGWGWVARRLDVFVVVLGVDAYVLAVDGGFAGVGGVVDALLGEEDFDRGGEAADAGQEEHDRGGELTEGN